MTDKQVYEETIKAFNGQCALCGNTNIALHHIRYGSLYGGRKTYLGNVIPLCAKHHNLVHTDKGYWMPKLIEIVDRRLKDD